MRVTAKVDYAVRALVELGTAEPRKPVKGDRIAKAQGIPTKFLENILSELKRSSLVASMRGAEGGYWLARPAEEIAIADIIRAVEGPMANVRGLPPEEAEFTGNAEPLLPLWVAVRAALREVLEKTTVADIVAGELPAHVQALADLPDAWTTR